MPAAPEAATGPAFSDELLHIYYQRLFPYDQMYRWLSYGNDPHSTSALTDKTYFVRREMSFTIANDIYIRYQCFKDKEDMIAQIQKMKPHKMDIGAVFSLPPRDHATVKQGAFQPVERELVFDIDLTDYDDVRTCCSGANICPKCWGYMAMAMKVMDAGLRADFGFKHILWVYSGRRGVHCWVVDEAARTLTNEARTALAGYFSVVSGGEGAAKKVSGLGAPLHFALQRAYDFLEPLFREHIIGEGGQQLLTNRTNWNKLLRTLPFENMADELDTRWQAGSSTAEEKWEELLSALEAKADKERQRSKRAKPTAGSSGPGGAADNAVLSAQQWKYETVFTHSYPRLDVNVSTHMNHLLKSPFVAHPKTGRVCVPIDCSKADEFDPFTVPTLRDLVNQIDAHSSSTSAGGDSAKSDLEKTALHPYIQFFDSSFLKPLYASIRRKLRDETDKQAAMSGDF